MVDFFQGGDRFSLSLHQLTALDASPAELIAIAGQLDCPNICLFTHVPERASGVYPLVGEHDVTMIAELLAAHRVQLCNLEVFPLDGEDMARLEPGLAIGAALGATRATVHIHGADHAVAVARYAAFCAMAARYAINAGLEFNAFSAVTSADAAAAIVREAAQPNGSLVLDMLHLVRSGGAAEDVGAIADIVGYAQLSDGPRDMAADGRWHEAVRERMPPGAGEFPIVETIRRLKPGTILDVEVPQTARRKAGLGAGERARIAVEASRRMIDAAVQGAGAEPL